jgi:hypothetical protein
VSSKSLTSAPLECGFNLGGQLVEVRSNADLALPRAGDTPTRRRLSQGHETRDWPTRPGNNDLLSGRSPVQQP